MSRTKCLVQWCLICLLILSPDIFSATGVVDSDEGAFGCTSGDGLGIDDNDDDEQTFRFDFSQSAPGWSVGFADLPQGQDGFFELIFDLRPLLPDLNPNRNGLFISGNNRSDDLFMFVRRRITGLQPNQTYLVDFSVGIGSEAGNDCIGAGGSPAITLKAGASVVQPVATPDANGFLRMNIDNGNQTVGGADMQVLGNIGVNVDCVNPVFAPKRLESSTARLFQVQTGDDGSLWLVVGTDSGFEGVTRLFYTRIEARFSLR
ncbi:MAG: hypothetical protein H0V34_13740 [Gammaproteobacteria bacterium]|nr:hypothetical protein [Gammaproteobacteria bacterium]